MSPNVSGGFSERPTLLSDVRMLTAFAALSPLSASPVHKVARKTGCPLLGVVGAVQTASSWPPCRAGALAVALRCTPVTPEAPFFVGRAREARGSPDPSAVFRWSHLLDASRTAAARGRGRVGRGPGTGREARERRGGRRCPPAPATCAPALGPLSCDSRPPSPRANSCRCPMTRCCRCEQGGEH